MRSANTIQEDDEVAARDGECGNQDNALKAQQAIADGEDYLRQPLIGRAWVATACERQYIPDRHAPGFQNVVAQCQVSAQIAVRIEHALPNDQASHKDGDEQQISDTRQSTPQHAGIVHKKAAPPVPPCRIG